jgi:hypothetical protein
MSSTEAAPQIVSVLITPRTAFMRWALARARESATWRSLIRLLTLVLALAFPRQAVDIGAIGIALAELVGVLLPDRVLGGQSSRITDPGQAGVPPL